VACDDVIIVRYADDFLVGFQHRDDAERFQRELSERLAKFRLELQPTKTRLIALGKLVWSAIILFRPNVRSELIR
jgi:hypothetical protein